MTGRHLDAGSTVSVYIDKEECLFVKSVHLSVRLLVRCQETNTHPLNAHLPPLSSRRANREIVCITPGSSSGPGPASIRLMIDRAEVLNPDTRYTYTEDPTVTAIEPNWTILK